MEAKAYSQNQIFEAAVLFAKTQGIIPAPEPSHAIKGAIDEAIAAREAGEERVILFNLCGHGHFDMQAYDDYLNGRLPGGRVRRGRRGRRARGPAGGVDPGLGLAVRQYAIRQA